MPKQFRRVEMLLPLRFNDGSPIPQEFIGDTILELRKRFGAVSTETQIIRDIWSDGDQTYHDDLNRIFVDVPEDDQTFTFFEQFKEVLKNRFQQLDIWMTTYLVDVI